MLDIDDEKLPPPKPASAAATSRALNDTPGRRVIAAATMGMNSSSATIVQLRPPNLATANVYGIRMAAPTAAGTVVSRNFRDGSIPYSGPRNRTNTDHIAQIENPTCSEKTDCTRFRRAIRSPPPSQNSRSSGRQSSIQ